MRMMMTLIEQGKSEFLERRSLVQLLNVGRHWSLHLLEQGLVLSFILLLANGLVGLKSFLYFVLVGGHSYHPPLPVSSRSETLLLRTTRILQSYITKELLWYYYLASPRLQQDFIRKASKISQELTTLMIFFADSPGIMPMMNQTSKMHKTLICNTPDVDILIFLLLSLVFSCAFNIRVNYI